MQLKGMPQWNIRRHAVKGETDFDFCYALGDYASVVYPIDDEITKAALEYLDNSDWFVFFNKRHIDVDLDCAFLLLDLGVRL